MNSARLLAVSLLPNAVAAAQIGHVSPVYPSISIITLPLPQVQGCPVTPPSKNPTLVRIACPVVPCSPLFWAHLRLMNSAVLSCGAVVLVSGYSPVCILYTPL
ncbi:hypothetical protein PF005_g8949 [Phytophthora fragariae]|uniref:RxLR effector protein n=1 Tax=Phytophthora fragariae TaxID=53985 RepID=A0A6A3TXS9_9STRA|nr:hypothetical protein PF003_g28026 [Phytophthora fragariae]KAE8940264.1 hypothetical protein PF009_g9925 [Phytophthora fragariae]KAE9014789.1 hypothetical protein PF011_g7913 [Phytophthora fragariae]KAE9118147.1 hypothetical protein PF007_g9037 [Phytophthora fragariae]KAE9118210.1 hypothetical protein PF010_g8304 [Phytophthora fragariae]